MRLQRCDRGVVVGQLVVLENRQRNDGAYYVILDLSAWHECTLPQGEQTSPAQHTRHLETLVVVPSFALLTSMTVTDLAPMASAAQEEDMHKT